MAKYYKVPKKVLDKVGIPAKKGEEFRYKEGDDIKDLTITRVEKEFVLAKASA